MSSNRSTILLTADLHLTSKPEDAYRWEIFKALAAEARELKNPAIVLLGDIADFKDNHDAEFVNLLSTHLVELSKFGQVHFVMGNHDMVKPDWPFFEYVNSFTNVFYHKKPYALHEKILFLPFTKTPEADWEALDLSSYDFVMMHQPCIGAISSEFYELTHGMDPKYFSKKHPEFKGMVFSGDIHIAQTVGDVNYVGAPYPVRMGDTIKGGFLKLHPEPNDEWVLVDMPLSILRKMTVQVDTLEELFKQKASLKNTAAPPYKDFLQVRVNFSPDAYENWNEYKAKIKDFVTNVLGCEFKGVTMKGRDVKFSSIKSQAFAMGNIVSKNKQDILAAVADREKLDESLVKTAMKLIEES